MLLYFVHALFLLVISLNGVIAIAWSLPQSSIEPDDFDPVAALQSKGIDVAALLAAQDIHVHRSNEYDSCAVSCRVLRLVYGSDQVLQPNTSAYQTSTQDYFSTFQTAATPYCVFTPLDTESVSVFILLTRATTCQFAIKSGGHANFAGASSTSVGATLSLEKLNQTSLSDDSKSATIGSGARWANVYAVLDDYNVTVIGGRFASIGVGGFVLGGGLSFFSNSHGWACDNVASYEVVTACGDILVASPTQHSDLYFALRGGGNNFGIVTRIHVYTYSLPAATIWGGSRFFAEEHFTALNHAFSQQTQNSEQDRLAGWWFTYVAVNGTKIAVVETYYNGSMATDASIFSDYMAIPSFSDGTKDWKLSDYTKKFEPTDPYGFREYSYNIVIKNDESLNNVARDIFFEEVAGVQQIITMSYQSITVPQLESMTRNGGNPLGISIHDGPLVLIELNCAWPSASDDTSVFTAASNTLSRIKAEAVSRGLEMDFVYMNYASQYQDVIASYGPANKARLQTIAARYDPRGVLQDQSPGGFKLGRAPVPGTLYFDN